MMEPRLKSESPRFLDPRTGGRKRRTERNGDMGDRSEGGLGKPPLWGSRPFLPKVQQSLTLPAAPFSLQLPSIDLSYLYPKSIHQYNHPQ